MHEVADRGVDAVRADDQVGGEGSLDTSCVNESHRDGTVLIPEAVHALPGAVLARPIAVPRWGRVGNHLGGQPVKVGSEDAVKQPPAGEMADGRELLEVLALPVGDAGAHGWGAALDARVVVSLQDLFDGRAERDARLVAAADGPRILLEDYHVAAVAFEVEAVEEAREGAPDLGRVSVGKWLNVCLFTHNYDAFGHWHGDPRGRDTTASTFRGRPQELLADCIIYTVCPPAIQRLSRGVSQPLGTVTYVAVLPRLARSDRRKLELRMLVI